VNLDRDTLQNAVGPETVESIGEIVLGVGALAFVVALASLLPGLDLPVPQTPVTLAAVVGALATVAVAGLLLYLASGLAALTRLALDGPADVVEHVASVVHWLVVLATALVAHAGLAPAVQPLFGGVGWLYDVTFLLAALGPLVVVAARLSVVVDPLAALVAQGVTHDGDIDDSGTDTQAPGWTPEGSERSG